MPRCIGAAVACGNNGHGQCDPPALVADLSYTQVSAGWLHTVLFTSDGAAVACGRSGFGECDLPALVGGLTYTSNLLPPLLLQASFDGDSMRFATLGGADRCRIGVEPSARLADVYGHLMADHRASGLRRVDAILPEGRLLSSFSAEETVASVFGLAP